MLNQERLSEIENKKLNRGSGSTIDTACIMQMVSYITGDKWTDSPECACPVLTRYAIYLNDKFNDDDRQKMKKFIVPLVGTRMNDETQIARKRLIMFRYVTVTYPLLLDLWKLPDLATEFRALSNSIKGMAKAKELLAANKSKIYAHAYAYASAYADALRERIMESALETLRLAIEVKI